MLNTVYGNSNCLDCGNPIVQHGGQQCPPPTPAMRFRQLAALAGNRPRPFRSELPWSGCPCAKHTHS